MFQLNGIVGGISSISVGAGKTILLQQIQNSRALSRSDSWRMTLVRR